MNKTIAVFGALAVALCTMGDSCDAPTSETKQNAQQEQLNLQAVESVGMPGITQFSEKRQLKAIFELRDKAISTTTYIVDLSGNLHKVCDSIGFGIPYATQYTAPQRRDYSGSYGIAVPQADPNGLYSPPGADGTWVLCLDPHTKRTVPLYIEPRIIVSPYALTSK